jgi:uncharacterized protein
MVDCLPATGPAGPVPLLLGLALLVAGVVAYVLARRGNRRGGTAIGLALLLALGASALAVAPAAPARADGCPSPTASPTSSPAPAILPDQAVTFTSGGVTFSGSYRGPSNPTVPVAAVVIVGGTGGIDRDGSSPTLPMDEYRWLADRLSAQGVASFRYDKLGTGVTGLGPYAADPSTMLPLGYDQLRVQPARDALSFVAALPGIDASRLLLAGHSEGGAVVLSIAAAPGSAPPVAGLLLIEPAYAHILDVVSRQLSQQMDDAVVGGAMSAPDAATLTNWMDDGVVDIRTGTPPYPAPGAPPLPGATGFTALMQTTIETNFFGSDPAQMVLGHAYRELYGKQFDEIDPAALASTLSIPALVTCGTKDFNTPCGDGTPGTGIRALAAAFAPGLARFVELPDTVHILRDVGAADVPNIADQIPYPYSPLLATELQGFLAPFAG